MFKKIFGKILTVGVSASLLMTSGITSLCADHYFESNVVKNEKGQWRIERIIEYGISENDRRPDYCETEYVYYPSGAVRCETKTYYKTEKDIATGKTEKTFFCQDYREFFEVGKQAYSATYGNGESVYEEAWFNDRGGDKNVYVTTGDDYVTCDPTSEDGVFAEESFVSLISDFDREYFKMSPEECPKKISFNVITPEGSLDIGNLVFICDSNDNPVKQVFVKPDKDTTDSYRDETVQFEAVYDENQNCTKTICYGPGGEEKYVCENTYDENSELSKSTKSEQGKDVLTTSFKYEYEYDENGLLKNKTTYVYEGENEVPAKIGHKEIVWKYYPTQDEEYLKQYGLSGYYMRDFYKDESDSPMIIEGKNESWNTIEYKYKARYSDAEPDKSYWYENGIKQGTYYDHKAVLGLDPEIGVYTNRGREICDRSVLDQNGNGTWYWLDSWYDGAKAVGKEVWIPYIYQNEDEWDDAAMRSIAEESDPGMADCVYKAMKEKAGKWVRYDDEGKMIKGWYTVGIDEYNKHHRYRDQLNNTYYYDTRTGLMAKGHVTIDGKEYYFDEITGVLQGTY